MSTAGIVGMTNVGKSTFFKRLTNSTLSKPANYPFATINPVKGNLLIPNNKLFQLQHIYNAKKITQSSLSLLDIAGLVKGASQGKGLGNKFLNDIKSVDLIFHLCRAFIDPKVTHVETSVDPLRDLVLIQDELILKDLDTLDNLLMKNSRSSKNSNNIDRYETRSRIELINNLQDHLYNGLKLYDLMQDCKNDNDKKWCRENNFLTNKPTIIILNVTLDDYLMQSISNLDEIIKWRDQYAPKDKILFFNDEFEEKYNELSQLNSDPLKAIQDFFHLNDRTKPVRSSVDIIVDTMRNQLNLISFYTCGNNEVKQWVIPNGSTAIGAAAKIHSDIAESFLFANITHFHKFDTTIRVKKDYIMQDNDIVYFKSVKGIR